MKKISRHVKSFATCASCPLNKKLYDQGSVFRSDVGETVRRIAQEIETTAGTVTVYGAMPPFVQEIAEHYDTEGVANEAWRCSRIRRLGQCASIEVLFPKPEYL